MKRLNSLYEKIYNLDNLLLADAKACKGKSWQYGVELHSRNRLANLVKLQEDLKNKTYRTSPYTIFKVYEPKEREIYRLPFYPDRIVHHAVMNVLESIFVSTFTADTYSCIKGRGIHGAAAAVKKALRDLPGTTYCLKLDIKKFYPSIDHDVMKSLIRRKIKDTDLLWLLDEVIDSAPGLPIGNYLSQYLANFYLTYFDHWLKEIKRVKYYFRYADDLVILSHSKQELHSLLIDIQNHLNIILKLEVKDNWQIFPVSDRGIDFVGYRFHHTHTLLRKTIKKNFARMLATRPNEHSIASYMGWISHCNGNHLTKTLLHDKFQRPRHKADNAGIHRRQDQTEPDPQSADNSSQIQDRGFKLSREGKWEAPGTAAGVKRQSTHSFFGINNADGHDQASTRRQISFDNNDCKN